MSEDRTAIVPFENRVATVPREARYIDTSGGEATELYFRGTPDGGGRITPADEKRIFRE